MGEKAERDKTIYGKNLERHEKYVHPEDASFVSNTIPPDFMHSKLQRKIQETTERYLE